MQDINWKRLFLHLFLLIMSTFVGGFIVGFLSAATGSTVSIALVGLVNIVAIFIAVFIITLIHKISWTHFLYLMLLIGLFSLTNMLAGSSVVQVIRGTLLVAVIGGVAKLFADLIMHFNKKSSD